MNRVKHFGGFAAGFVCCVLLVSLMAADAPQEPPANAIELAESVGVSNPGQLSLGQLKEMTLDKERAAAAVEQPPAAPEKPRTPDELALRLVPKGPAAAGDDQWVAGAGDLNLPAMVIAGDNKIGAARLLLSLLLFQNDGSGNLKIVTNPEALPIANTFWEMHAQETGMEAVAADPENPTAHELARCILRKIRRPVINAHVASAAKTTTENYVTTLNQAQADAKTEAEAVVGVDE